MAIYHCSVQMIGRSAGRSAVASSAYRSGEKVVDRETGVKHDYSRKAGVVYSEIDLCPNAPSAYEDRETLWNEFQKVEKAKNAQLAREVQVALPKELDKEAQIKLTREYVQQNFVKEGMCADWSIHDKGDGNPHAHIMLTTRPIKENGEWGQKEKKGYALDPDGKRIPILDEETGEQKIGKNGRKMWKRETLQVNDWNSRDRLMQWRENWAKICNKELSPELAIDHRSNVDRGIEQIPTIHEGYAAREIEKRGGISDRCQMNREIGATNAVIRQLVKQIKELEMKAAELVKEKGRELNERIGKLLGIGKHRANEQGRDNRAVGGETGKIRDGKRAERGKDTDAFIREIEARVSHVETSRKEREVEQQRQDIERQQQAREAEQIVNERSQEIHSRSVETGRSEGRGC